MHKHVDMNQSNMNKSQSFVIDTYNLNDLKIEYICN